MGLLGSFEVSYNGRAVPIGGPRQRTVLAALMLSPDRVMSVDYLIDEVWNGAPPSTGRAQIAICVSALRKVFRTAGVPQQVIVTVAPGYKFVAGEHVVDTVEFARRAEAARHAAENGARDRAIGLLRDALRLWRGPVLDGVTSRAAETEAVRLDEQRLLVTERYMALRLESGEHQTLLSELGALVRENPLRERFLAQLMLAQYRAGQRVEALRTFREGRREFVAELGLEPGTELQRLHRSILRDDSTAVGPAAGPASSARTTAEPSGGWPNPAQLPSNISAFAGREEELAELDGLLAERSDNDPVGIGFVTGAPGVGKSALAIRWAHRAAAHFPDGTLYADLQEADRPLSPLVVLQRFLRGLGVEAERIPGGLEECAALYRTVLRGRRTLVILNDVASLRQLRPLLPGNGRSCALVTGRTQLQGLIHSGSPLRLCLGPLRPEDSVILLSGVVQGRRLVRRLTLAARLAALCDHHPLALRAAGERLASKPHWTLADLVARLEDPGRRLNELSHGEHSVRARLEGGYRALDAAASRAYRVFGAHGSAVLDVPTAADLLNVSLSEAEDTIERLLDAHLLEVVTGREGAGGHRYRFRELPRLHAREAARSAGRRHAGSIGGR
ncbi:DNA-binding transcriptional activator of the SARP family [Streptomyces zhaozhouensis]|uniref:DNA-binding transcriptional activator of the SARP family n=1 Tax=Streptomyces zhaozhouensis TaxID=1300267 RepID=A0A286DN78_9ACTN|nr:AfsR/SARP family transcriptional regulator [Streptomyces zhaozhouensis]SOD60089.1 DNA-binding transcriptional activator of the SARP family [Streptomyces zhaozhouensis]